MYTGYYCKKCKLIPLIKTNLTNNKNLNFMIKCKCHINCLTLEEMNKIYYTNNIDKKNIKNEKIIDDIENDDSFLLKTKEILSNLKKYNKQLSIIKNDNINFLKEKIKEIENIYDKAIKINDNLESIIFKLINSYESLNSNYSNIKNIKYLTNIKLKEIEKDYDNISINREKINELIQSCRDLIYKFVYIPNNELENISELYPFYSKYLMIYNDELLFLQTRGAINIYPISDLKLYTNISLPSLIKFDTDRENNILCLFPKDIKVFSSINYDQIKCLKKKENNNIYNIQNLDVKPILEIKIKKKYDNIISLNDNNNENKFIVHDKTSFYFFQYDLNKKSYVIINSFNFEIIKIELIEYNNNKALLLFNSSYLSLFDISKLKIIKRVQINFKNNDTIITTQINNKSLLITKNNYIYLIKLKNFQIKLKIDYKTYIKYLFQLRDKTIIICDLEYAKRYSPKTFEMMSVFYDSLDKRNSIKYSDISLSDYNYINMGLQISDTKIVFILRNGECLLKKLTF